MAAHPRSMLPGARVDTDAEPGPDRTGPGRGAFRIGGEHYRMEPGTVEYVLLARLTGGQEARPVFLFRGQRAITHQAATRYLAPNHGKPARTHGNSSFCPLPKVINSRAYGPDVVEVIADVTRAARTPVPDQDPPPAPVPRASHGAAG